MDYEFVKIYTSTQSCIFSHAFFFFLIIQLEQFAGLPRGVSVWMQKEKTVTLQRPYKRLSIQLSSHLQDYKAYNCKHKRNIDPQIHNVETLFLVLPDPEVAVILRV